MFKNWSKIALSLTLCVGFVSSGLADSNQPAGLQGMSCDKCVTQCEERNRAMSGATLNTAGLRPLRLAEVARRARVTTGGISSECEQRCTRLSVSLCLNNCHQGSEKLQKVCNKQCAGLTGSDQHFCLETCFSSTPEAAEYQSCATRCQEASC